MKEELPGVLELGWWLFMKPARLRRRLNALGVAPGDSGLELWTAGAVSKTYLVRTLCVLLVCSLWAFPLSYLSAQLGETVSWPRVALLATIGFAMCAAAMMVGGKVFVVADLFRSRPARTLAEFETHGGAQRDGGGIADVVNFNLAIAIVIGLSHGVRGSEQIFLFFVAAFTIAGRIYLAPMITTTVTLIVEVPTQLVAYALARAGFTTLHWVPVLHHDHSQIPHPFLADHILLGADSQPEIARAVLDACTTVPAQRKAGERALVHLQVRDLERLARAGGWAAIVELSSPWLPGVQAATQLQLAFREIARYVLAAQVHSSPRAQLQQIERAGQQLSAVENALLGANTDESRALRAVVPTWRAILDTRAATLTAAASVVLPNPFRAGRPLSPEEGAETFRGREALSSRLSQLLADPTKHNTLLLLGPRRCGKTSLLKMLPVLLPDALVTFIDLQDNPTHSPRAFFQAIAKQAREAARHDRRFTVPELPDGPPFEAASRWLDALERSAQGYRVLLCIDEFERLETLFPGDRADLLRLMGLLRGITQHRRAVHLLVSGVAPFDELDLMWSDHFIGAHELRVEHLDGPTTVGLLTRPSDDFPPGTIPTEVAEEVFRRTDGQPYLVQLYGQLLVLHLDATKRRAATVADVDAVQDEVYSAGSAWFRYTFSDCTTQRQALLRRLSEGEPVPLARADQRWLQRRGVVTPDGQIRVPVFASWIREIAE